MSHGAWQKGASAQPFGDGAPGLKVEPVNLTRINYFGVVSWKLLHANAHSAILCESSKLPHWGD